ncbi:hypothetical protein [Sulfobacillus harzensis]|uniref:PTS EIIA type-4 domain-containing protein n=1 Tax=Sulfobacillus harzensis TaxID=2729629 RepID=A0A7Y0L2U2_9FIRM|nr:hypothetical protein [Sulfobacillus harzensis]
MIALLLVSHLDRVAAAVRDLITELAGADVVVGTAGGTSGFGVDLATIEAEIRRLSDRGATHIVALGDMGSSVILLEESACGADVPIEVVDAPFLEGAVASAMVLATGGGASEARTAAEAAYDLRKR